ncbi:MAG: hypothetical protein L0Y72_11785 [Gemmataceae bacterium]|nr:hypothetical protein [Gemmataceae bacterium]
MQFRPWAGSFFLMLAMLGPLVAQQPQQPRELLDQIFSDWSARQKGARSIGYTLKGQGVVPKGTYAGHPALPARLKHQQVPEHDHVYEIELRWLLDLENNRIRRELSESVFNIDLASFVPAKGVYVYNGSASKRYFPKEFNKNPTGGEDVPEVGIAKNANTVPCDPVDYPVFLSHGIVSLNAFSTSPGPDRLVIPIDRDAFTFVDRGRIGERECAVLRYRPEKKSTRYEEFWVDTRANSAVLRVDVYEREKLELRVEVEYRKDGDVPNRWAVTSFKGAKGEVCLTESLSVIEFVRNPKVSSEDFDIELKPGMVIRQGDAQAKRTGFSLKNYRLAPDGQTLIEIGDEVGDSGHWWTIIGVLLLTSLVTLFVLGRKGLLPSINWWRPRRK